MGEERLLLRTLKNEILEVITLLELNPSDFEFHRIKSSLVNGCVVSKMYHKPTKYYFTFDFDRHSNHYIIYFPTEEGKKYTKLENSMEIVKARLLDWLIVIKREISVPDLWATIIDEKKLFEVVSGVGLGNELFTDTQQKYITEQLQLIKQNLIDTQELIGNDMEFVVAKFDYLENALTRLGQYDWVHDVIGAAVTIIWGIALAPGPAKELFRSLGKIISHVLGGSTYLSLP